MNQRPPPPTSSPPGPIDESLLDELPPAELEALRWAVRVDNGLSAQARAEFEAWLDADPLHPAAFGSFASVSQALGALPPVVTARLGAAHALDKAASSAARERVPQPVPPPGEPAAIAAAPTRRAASRWLPAAAAVLAVFVTGSGWLGWDHWQEQSTFSRDYATLRGQNLTAELPDGSSLVLDTATQASVTLYRNRREVRLPEGQVLFQVRGNKEQPFDVLAGQSRITVVGTKFSVRYTPSLGDRSVQVAVQEGRVRVSRAHDAQQGAVDLVPGQAVTADAQGMPGRVTQVPAAAIASWQDQRLNFENAPLGSVLAELRRYGHAGLQASDPAVARMPVTASVDLRDTATFARVLQQVLPVRLVQRGDGLEIVAK